MAKPNKLLSALGQEQIERLGPRLEPVELPFKQVVQKPGEPLAHAYFVTAGVLSMVNEPVPGEIVEVATIGAEGMLGLPLLLHNDSSASTCLVQIPGSAYRMQADIFRAALKESPAFETILMRYALAFLAQVSQGTSCNRLHEVQERCARWLLQTHDRVESDSFPLTQEFLAQMLGVHRPTVSLAAAMLQKAGLIAYTRGRITILDRAGLEQASCPCYSIIQQEYDRLVSPLAKA